MFTGIIEEVGKIKDVVKTNDGKKISIISNIIIEDINEGDSISINGVCLTAYKVNKQYFIVDVVKETLAKTNLGELSKDSLVNLERSMTLSTRIGGHILQGHVETVGTIIEKIINNESQLIKISLDPSNIKYCIPKGSIAIEGISLTIVSITKNIATIALIPHTIKNTNLCNKEVGDSVNVETDILGKYIERFITYHASFDNLDELLLDKMKYWELGET